MRPRDDTVTAHYPFEVVTSKTTVATNVTGAAIDGGDSEKLVEYENICVLDKIGESLMRTSEIPSKQMALLLLAHSEELKKRFPVGVDVACNNFYNLPLFRVAKYVGTDIVRPDSEPVKRGVACAFILSDAVTEEIPRGDLMICLETIGITSLFKHSESVKVVKKMAASTNPAGTLVINVGPLTPHNQRDEIVGICKVTLKMSGSSGTGGVSPPLILF